MMKYLKRIAGMLILVMSGFAISQAPVEAEVVISQAELDQMLAPIALYPDTVLSHILVAATYPLEVVQAERWVRENSELSAEDALLAAEVKDWDPSVTALVAFPNILRKMSDELDWTSRLGDAFLQDEEMVLQRVQDLRLYAHKAGNLDSLEHLKVTREKTTIIIEPAEPEVIYVPYYDTRVVYGDWWWPSYPPIYWAHSPHYRHSSHFYWAPRIHIGASFYFSSVHWHNRHIVRVPYYRNHDHRIRSGRHVVRHRDSRRWEHEPRHRRGVEYRNDRVRHRFVESRQPRREHVKDNRQIRQRHASNVSSRLRNSVSADERRDRHATRRVENERNEGKRRLNVDRETQPERRRVEPYASNDGLRSERRQANRSEGIKGSSDGKRGGSRDGKRYISDPQIDDTPRLRRQPQSSFRNEDTRSARSQNRDSDNLRASPSIRRESVSSGSARSTESRYRSNSRASSAPQRQRSSNRSGSGRRSEGNRSRHHQR